MIEGIGIDMVEIDRIEKANAKSRRFIERILTEREREYFHSLHHTRRQMEFLAGRFAAKEAFSKAAGTGLGHLSFQHIEILPAKNGKPVITANGFEPNHIHISISHSKAYAIAQVIITQ